MLCFMNVDPPPPSADAEPTDTITAPPSMAEPRPSFFHKVRVFRSVRDRYVAGVAGGAAERLDVDPLFIRLGLVAATLVLGRDESGVAVLPLLAYFAAWTTLPTTSDRSLLRRIRQRPAQQEIVGAGAVLILGILLLSRPSLIWAGVLFAIAVAMLTDRGRPEATNEPEATALTDRPLVDGSPTPQAGNAEAMTSAERARTWGRSLRGAPLLQREPRVREPRPPRRSPKLWPLTASLLFAYGFACVLLDNLLDNGVDPGVAVNGALLIIGAVMLLSGWRGRAWITLFLVLPIIPLWMAFSVAGIDRVADQPLALRSGGYEDGAVIQASQSYGGLTVDLSRVDLPMSGEITAEVGVTAGQVDVWVPRDAEIRLIGNVGLGNIQVYREFDWYSTQIETVTNWGLNRSYPALGRECFESWNDDESLRYLAEREGVVVSPTATPAEIADAIETAGFTRPINEIIRQDEQRFDSQTGEFMFDEQTGEPIFETTNTNQWSIQTSESGGLCLPEPAPENPLVITIDATLGIGNLKVHRV